MCEVPSCGSSILPQKLFRFTDNYPNTQGYKKRIVNDHHRFMKWEHRYGSYPAILDESDFDEICHGNYHFLRKVDLEHSQLLRKKLNDYYGNTICK